MNRKEHALTEQLAGQSGGGHSSVDIFFADEDPLACVNLTKQQNQPDPHTAPGSAKERRDTVTFVFENDLLDSRK